MINISNCPITGLKRKLTYDFYWLHSVKQIIVECTIKHYITETVENGFNDVLIENARIVSYTRPLMASDTLVDPIDGHILSEIELNNETQQRMKEYDFYVYVLGATPVILPTLIERIITARDAEGKFNV